jgi:D-alanyl-D-alanine carboxypeptidase
MKLPTHTSGITSYFEEDLNPDYEALWQQTLVYNMRTRADFLPLLDHKPMKFAPGERFDFNDGGFITPQPSVAYGRRASLHPLWFRGLD